MKTFAILAVGAATGILNSEKKHFFIDGGTKVKIIPDKWKVSRIWDENSKRTKYRLRDQNDNQVNHVRIELKYDTGNSLDDYDRDFFYWNRKVKLKAESWKPDWFFTVADVDDCLENLGRLEPGKTYPVSITGKLKNGMPIFGGQNILVIKYDIPRIPYTLTDQPALPNPLIIRPNQ